MYKNKKEIKRRLEEHLKMSGVKDNLFGIFLKGSQNYMSKFNVNSDVDSVVIYIPNVNEILNENRTKRKTIKLECGEEIAFLDIRSFFKEVESPTLFTVEILSTEYFLLNKKYEKEYYQTRRMLGSLLRANKKTIIENICKKNEKNLRYIEQNGLCQKRAFHLIRMSKSAVKVNLGKKAKECLKPLSDYEVESIKYKHQSSENILLKEKCYYYYHNSKTLTNVAEDSMEEKSKIKKKTNEIVFSILKREFL